MSTTPAPRRESRRPLTSDVGDGIAPPHRAIDHFLRARPDGDRLADAAHTFGLGRVLATDPELAHAFSRWWYGQQPTS